MKEILSLAKMDVILALALLDKSLVPKTHANKHAIMKAAHTMKEIPSLAKTDVTLVLALPVKSLVPRTHANKHATMKVKHTMKEIHSHAKTDVIPALALLDKSIVAKTHADLRLVHVTVIVILDFIVPNNPVMILNKVLALNCLRAV
jgi:hypothetical protein